MKFSDLLRQGALTGEVSENSENSNSNGLKVASSFIYKINENTNNSNSASLPEKNRENTHEPPAIAIVAIPATGQETPKPYLDASGSLIIPFGSDHRYHWWKGGQPLSKTIREVKSLFVSTLEKEAPEIIS